MTGPWRTIRKACRAVLDPNTGEIVSQLAISHWSANSAHAPDLTRKSLGRGARGPPSEGEFAS